MTQAYDHAIEFMNMMHSTKSRAIRDKECIEYINRYNDFYETPINRWSALMRAVAFKHKNTVTELIRKGADINYKSLGGHTSLALSCRYRQQDLAIILLEAGAIFVDIIDSHIVKHNCNQVIQYIRSVYRQRIISVINNESSDNALAASFKTTYVSGIIGMISEFII
jgi:ankyrin repeat protein